MHTIFRVRLAISSVGRQVVGPIWGVDLGRFGLEASFILDRITMSENRGRRLACSIAALQLSQMVLPDMIPDTGCLGRPMTSDSDEHIPTRRTRKQKDHFTIIQLIDTYITCFLIRQIPPVLMLCDIVWNLTL